MPLAESRPVSRCETPELLMISQTTPAHPCVLCNGVQRTHVFSQDHTHMVHVVRCANCGLQEDTSFVSHAGAAAQSAQAVPRIRSLLEHAPGVVTLITCSGGPKSLQALLAGICAPRRLEVVDYSELGKFSGSDGIIIVDDHLMDQQDPVKTLRALRARLHNEQTILFVVELVGSSRRWLQDSQTTRKSPARFWPNWVVFHKCLLASGFDRIWLYDPETTQRGSPFAIISAHVGSQRDRPLLSIIMPVFNERATFNEAIERVLAKDIPGIDKRILIVESNSTDGTKDLVAAYEGHENIDIIWQPAPKGKGHAVREGLAAATGDMILIQDADLEYDVNDYDALIEELRSWRASFVLGSRHTGERKIRKFYDTPFIADLFNVGHIFFTGLLNLLLQADIKDPFTMYKVFYRDCVHGLNFRCKRFDFDHELVVKLYRKGFHPIEIPVNYAARSFSEGKKVSILRDGMTWILTDFQLVREPLEIPGYR